MTLSQKGVNPAEHWRFADPDPRSRLAAIASATGTLADVYAFRNLLVGDGDARVRRLAAVRLGSFGGLAMLDPLLEAASFDPLPSVRDACWRSIARIAPLLSVEATAATEASHTKKRRQEPAQSNQQLRSQIQSRLWSAAAHAIANESVWWVRMAVATAVASTPRPQRVSDLRQVLHDPFWRVRHTAIRALVRIGIDDPSKRSTILGGTIGSDVEAAALLFIQRAWKGEHAGHLEPKPLQSPPADPLWDPDPAVISARLAAPGDAPSLGLLIELLADAHESTRKLAARHLVDRAVESGSTREIRIALQWLDEPRIPYASEAAAGLGTMLGDGATTLVADILADFSGTGNGALCWAITWIGKTRSRQFSSAILALLDHQSSAVQEAAITTLYSLGCATSAKQRLFGMASDWCASESLRLAATRTLIRVAPDLALGLVVDLENMRAPPRLRRVLTTEVAVPHRIHHWLQQAAIDEDAATRVAALRALAASRHLSSELRTAARSSHDPWVRCAVLKIGRGTEDNKSESNEMEEAATLVRSDSDAMVQRTALRLCRGSSANAVAARRWAANAKDPVLRTLVASLFEIDFEMKGGIAAENLVEFCQLLALTMDTEPMVRSAAVQRLIEIEKTHNVTSTVDRIIDEAPSHGGQHDDKTVKAALTWRCRHFDNTAADTLSRAWQRGNYSATVRNHLRALRIAIPEHLACEVPLPPQVCCSLSTLPSLPTLPSRLNKPLSRQLRELGQTGITVSPLVLSGAKKLSFKSLTRGFEAGVSTFFWEPRYQQLTAFLRQPEIASSSTVIAGSYHGTPDEIEADVDRALRLLRRTCLDVFLVFWVRSPQRLSEPVWQRLEQLKRRGKIRACGFSSHHRQLTISAITQHPWDVIMIRHSAAHTGAEQSLLTTADQRGVGVLAFTSLCYGRLLSPSPARRGTRAPDCYRYSLSQPGIHAVLSAPGQHRELIENLAVLDRPSLSERELSSMRDHGAIIYARSKDFAALVRRTPRQLPHQLANQMLAGDRWPSDENNTIHWSQDI